ncbi:uncharacterized protein LOC121379455 [Gigantopelta aegis]|uniref:uncharacterized protein LOC121379455 n=1 Tax=Gigantopelta aegis TaxID=1735272 RepID=UPI001B889120|nr:uncharacterized protein LOC121379455 [Gigantopelta aegis]
MYTNTLFGQSGAERLEIPVKCAVQKYIYIRYEISEPRVRYYPDDDNKYDVKLAVYSDVKYKSLWQPDKTSILPEKRLYVDLRLNTTDVDLKIIIRFFGTNHGGLIMNSCPLNKNVHIQQTGDDVFRFSFLPIEAPKRLVLKFKINICDRKEKWCTTKCSTAPKTTSKPWK